MNSKISFFIVTPLDYKGQIGHLWNRNHTSLNSLIGEYRELKTKYSDFKMSLLYAIKTKTGRKFHTIDNPTIKNIKHIWKLNKNNRLGLTGY